MSRRYQRIEHSVSIGHAEWRRVRRSAPPVEEPKPTIADRLQKRWAALVQMTTAVWDRMTKRQIAMITLSLGLFVGLVVLGWGLWPVQWDASTWTGASFNNLPETKRQVVLENSAELFSYTTDTGRVLKLTADWPEAPADICKLAAATTLQDERRRFDALHYILTGEVCNVSEE